MTVSHGLSIAVMLYNYEIRYSGKEINLRIYKTTKNSSLIAIAISPYIPALNDGVLRR
jgi:hypothetical protein